MINGEYFAEMAHAATIFTPGAPISRQDCFFGRAQQLQRVVEAIVQPGRHPIIYGQRGVGKTSLANIIRTHIQNVQIVSITCERKDSFHSVWKRGLQEAKFLVPEAPFGLSKQGREREISLFDFLTSNGKLTASTVGALLKHLDSVQGFPVVILDEFDRIRGRTSKSLMADLVKSISDSQAKVTLVTVGVADSVLELLGEHPSVARNLVQIEVPKMPHTEISAIFEKGFHRLNLVADAGVVRSLTKISDGFPHYAHLLGLCCAKVCIQERLKRVSVGTFARACEMAAVDGIAKYREAFFKATRTTQTTRYEEILCACAHAQVDEAGVFRASDVVSALQKTFKVDLSIQSVTPALGRFAQSDRGGILKKVPVLNRTHYEFSDPMIRPYLRIKAENLLQPSRAEA